jgi:hypothetical protein
MLFDNSVSLPEASSGGATGAARAVVRRPPRLDSRSAAYASMVVHMGAILAGSDQIWRAPDQIGRIGGTSCLAGLGGMDFCEACFSE